MPLDVTTRPYPPAKGLETEHVFTLPPGTDDATAARILGAEAADAWRAHLVATREAEAFAFERDRIREENRRLTALLALHREAMADIRNLVAPAGIPGYPLTTKPALNLRERVTEAINRLDVAARAVYIDRDAA